MRSIIDLPVHKKLQLLGHNVLQTLFQALFVDPALFYRPHYFSSPNLKFEIAPEFSAFK